MIKYILLILPPLAIIGAIYLIYTLTSNPDNWKTEQQNPGSSTSEIEARTINRGTWVSIYSAILLAVVGGVLAGLDVPENMIVINFGFLLGPVIGYMLDIGMGTDKGYYTFQTNFSEWIKFVFNNLVNSNFLRYIITVLLDLFISDPIQDVLREQLGPIREVMMKEGGYSGLVAQNLPSIVQAIVAFVTFNAYTNQTRFNWAYPSPLLPEDDRMSPFVVSLATAVAGSLYLVHNQRADDLLVKVIYVIVAIGILYAMNTFGVQEAPFEEDDEKKPDYITLSGMALFGLIFAYGLIWPILNAGGAAKSNPFDEL